MKKWVLVLLCMAVACTDETSAQGMMLSERQSYWDFVSYVTGTITVVMLVGFLLFGSVTFINYRKEILDTLSSLSLAMPFNFGSSKQKKHKHKKRKKRMHSHSQQEQEVVLPNDIEQNVQTEEVLHEAMEENVYAEAEQATNQENNATHQSRRSSKSKHKHKAPKTKMEKNKSFYRKLFYVCTITMFLAFFVYLLAEREKAKEDAPFIIHPDLMW